MSVAELTVHAEEMRRLRSDNAALQAALERTAAERDNWRTRANDLAFKLEQFKFSVARLCKETQA
jgi:predicted nuclease with TOPRIM domain